MRMTDPKPTETTEKPAEPLKPQEFGGAKRDSEPTRYNDWEINGKCVDF